MNTLFTAPALQSILASTSSFSSFYHGIITHVILWGGIVFTLVISVMLYLLAANQRTKRKPNTELYESDTKVIAISVALPTLLLALLFVVAFEGWIETRVPPAGAIDVQVNAKQWKWTYNYPKENIIGTPQFVVPEKHDIKLMLSSNDVVHGFSIPAFNVQQQVLPNRYTVAWFRPEKLGEYDVLSTHFSGTKYDQMVGRIKVVSMAKYKQWLSEGGGVGGTPLDQGRRLFTEKTCVTCHSITNDRKNLAGPPMGKMFGRKEKLKDGKTIVVDEAYIRESIKQPKAKIVAGFEPVMPDLGLNDKQIDLLIVYLKSLK